VVSSPSVEIGEPLRAEAWAPLLRETLAREGRLRWPLSGGSMMPTLPPECLVDVVPPPADLHRGALVVFALGDQLVAHRLVRSTATGWIAQGDGRRGPDRPLSPQQIIGAVEAAYANGRLIWPGRSERIMMRVWVARHYLLRPASWLWRRAKLARGRATGHFGIDAGG
jgi:hypothetical protein